MVKHGTMKENTYGDRVLKIALCEDEIDTARKVATLINECAKQLNLSVKLTVFESGESLLFHLWEDPALIDIIYMDIFLGKKNGVDVALELRDRGCNAQIIFLTSSEEYMSEAFDVQAVNYLLKGKIDVDKFKKVLSLAAASIQEHNEKMFTCEYKGITTIISFKNISYFEIWNKIVTVHHNGKRNDFYSNMKELIAKIEDKGFVQVHRSYIVNIAYVTHFYNNRLKLLKGQEIPIGKTYVNHFRNAFTEYMKRD